MTDKTVAELDGEIADVVRELADALRDKGWMLCTAESCTGGWMSKVCTDLPGSSDWFYGGYVCYSYPAKEHQLGVIQDDLVQHGAVSEEIASQMALGARRGSSAGVTVAATGIAGPGGGLPNKPVGLVCFGWSVSGGRIKTDSQVFKGDRDQVRRQTVLYGLRGVLVVLDELSD
jgi:nicotinamide-nucleotide amidase